MLFSDYSKLLGLISPLNGEDNLFTNGQTAQQVHCLQLFCGFFPLIAKITSPTWKPAFLAKPSEEPLGEHGSRFVIYFHAKHWGDSATHFKPCYGSHTITRHLEKRDRERFRNLRISAAAGETLVKWLFKPTAAPVEEVRPCGLSLGGAFVPRHV